MNTRRKNQQTGGPLREKVYLGDFIVLDTNMGKVASKISKKTSNKTWGLGRIDGDTKW